MGSLGLLPHGTVAIIVIAALLFAEEAGLPLIVVSGDLILPGAGMLVAAGWVNPWILLPVSVVAVIAGALACFAWSAAMGTERLHGLARRLHAGRHLDRAERRMRAAGWLGILVLRFVPGLRVYSTMVVGALRFDLGTFLRGMLPAAVVWVVGFTLIGIAAGGAVTGAMGEIDHYALEVGVGALAVVAAVVATRQLRRRAARPAAA